MDENKFEKVKQELYKIDDEIRGLRNKRFNINEEYMDSLKEKCRENIGRCFKKLKDNKIIAYCQIINIDPGIPTMRGTDDFNPNQYPSIWFGYPYNNSKLPFYKDELFSGAWGEGNDIIGKLNKISYEEISKKDFDKKFKEINQQWIKKMIGDDK